MVGAVVAPLGFALSLESSSTALMPSDVKPSHERFLPDAAKLLIVGATLFGVAAFVRKAI